MVIDSIEHRLEESIEDLMNNCQINFEEHDFELDKPPDIDINFDIFDESQELVDNFKKLVDNINLKRNSSLTIKTPQLVSLTLNWAIRITIPIVRV